MLMRAAMIFHSRLRQASFRTRVTVDGPSGLFKPGYVEGPVFREEVETGIGQMIMDPPGQLLPIALLLERIPERRNDDTGRRAHHAVTSTIPDMARVIALIGSAAVACFAGRLHFGAKSIHFRGAEC